MSGETWVVQASWMENRPVRTLTDERIVEYCFARTERFGSEDHARAWIRRSRNERPGWLPEAAHSLLFTKPHKTHTTTKEGAA